MIKYAVCPQWITAPDGDRHYIGVMQLVKLYGLQPGEWCIRWGDERDYGRKWAGLETLYPRFRAEDYDRIRARIERERA